MSPSLNAPTLEPPVADRPAPDRAQVDARQPHANDTTTSRLRRVLRWDGTILVGVGLAQVVNEALSHYGSTGIQGDTFADSPYTIGFIEAHGLGAMIGVMLLWAARQPSRRFFHKLAIAVHFFLGAANVVFWSSFEELGGSAGAGLAATLAHVVFIGIQGSCLLQSKRDLTRA